MLGLTIPDAIAFGSLCAAFLAALAGLLKSEGSGKPAPWPLEHRASAAQARGEAMAALTTAIADLAAAIRAATSTDPAHDPYTDMIHAILRCLDDHEHSHR